MSSVYTYTQARENLATILDTVSKNNEVVIINRRNAENVAIISESELNSLLETAHLLRSPRNAERLMETIGDALADKIPVQSIEDLKKLVGLE
ncbi:MAG: type II toxin-antitoxin system prevent-host-death family antitoxin [Ignavibacteriales bacterium]|nr:type II toxin-antitoxin system prevent-host-death family antitoxin [Ignavibacteriales bacterium]